MPSPLLAATRLLADAHDLDAARALLPRLGFPLPPNALDPRARTQLGVPPACGSALVARGPGALRLLLVDVGSPAVPAPPRELLSTIGAALARTSPALLWIVVLVERGGPCLAIATWAASATTPRIAALVIDRRRVVQSDAETWLALTAAPLLADAPGADLLTHARWLDLLGRDGLSRAFYRALERTVYTLADAIAVPAHAPPLLEHQRVELALLYVSRLLFLAFLQARGWLDGDRAFLARTFASCTSDGGDYHRRILRPLFFGTLNTPRSHRAPLARRLGRIPFLNGGLFAPTPLERRHRRAHFPDAALGALFDQLLDRYRFTAHEDSSAFTEAAVDPEMLGRAFESLMAARERHSTGAFYTPQHLVERLTNHALADALARASDDAADTRNAADTRAALLLVHQGQPPADAPARHRLHTRLLALRILDPACGSGAFLVHALERIATLATLLGDPRPTSELRRAILTRSLFGVDVNPTAVWLCELRLWLSVVVEHDEPDPHRIPPLPNLDHHVHVGDTLAGHAFEIVPADAPRPARRLAMLRERYARATGARKRTLAQALDHEERTTARGLLDTELRTRRTQRTEHLRRLRARDLFGERSRPTAADQATLEGLRSTIRTLLQRRRALDAGSALPFTFAAHFADVAHAGGMDVVLGNPPWVRAHHVPAAMRASLRARYVVHREAAWRAGAAGGGAGRGFASQVDLAALFVERGVGLLRPGGTLALLLPAKLWRSLAGGGVRGFLSRETELRRLEDWSDARHAFDASVYPSLLVARRRTPVTSTASSTTRAPADSPTESPTVALRVRHAAGDVRWRAAAATLTLDATPGAPWLLLPPSVRAAFDHVRNSAHPTAPTLGSRFGPPRLGVKCGCNDAFIVQLTGSPPDDTGTHDSADRSPLVPVAARGRSGTVEHAMLRPVLRGEHVIAWTARVSLERMLWTHGGPTDAPLDRLPPHAARWLAPYRARLLARTDARPTHPTAARAARWWSLFRTDGATSRTARVVWPDIGRTPRAAVLRAGDTSVPLNSCYLVPCPSDDDAHALAALLNSPLAAAWLAAVAEPARGGYRRFLGWTMALLPLPPHWDGPTRATLATIGRLGASGHPPDRDTLHDAVLQAYALDAATVAPLLAWHDRTR